MLLIKDSLLLSNYEQLWVVQYGEIGRRSLVGIRVGESLSPSNMFFVISWECILQPAIMDQSGGLLLGSHLCYECYRVFLWQKLYCTSSINVFLFSSYMLSKECSSFFKETLSLCQYLRPAAQLLGQLDCRYLPYSNIHFSEFMLIFCS